MPETAIGNGNVEITLCKMSVFYVCIGFSGRKMKMSEYISAGFKSWASHVCCINLESGMLDTFSHAVVSFQSNAAERNTSPHKKGKISSFLQDASWSLSPNVAVWVQSVQYLSVGGFSLV